MYIILKQSVRCNDTAHVVLYVYNIMVDNNRRSKKKNNSLDNGSKKKFKTNVPSNNIGNLSHLFSDAFHRKTEAKKKVEKKRKNKKQKTIRWRRKSNCENRNFSISRIKWIAWTVLFGRIVKWNLIFTMCKRCDSNSNCIVIRIDILFLCVIFFHFFFYSLNKYSKYSK